MADFIAARGTGSTGVSSTLAITPTGTCAAGNTLVMGVQTKDAANILSIADTKGNPWQQSVSVGFPPTVIVATTIFSCPLITALTGSDTVTVTLTGGGLTINAIMAEFTGIVFPHDTEVPNDVSAAAFGTGAVFSVGPTAATSYPFEIGVACFSYSLGSPTFTAGSGWTSIGSVLDGNGVRTGLEYQLLTATGQQTATATFSLTGAAWSGSLVTFITDTPVNAPPPVIGT